MNVPHVVDGRRRVAVESFDVGVDVLSAVEKRFDMRILT
jgi:hypothetical protein